MINRMSIIILITCMWYDITALPKKMVRNRRGHVVREHKKKVIKKTKKKLKKRSRRKRKLPAKKRIHHRKVRKPQRIVPQTRQRTQIIINPRGTLLPNPVDQRESLKPPISQINEQRQKALEEARTWCAQGAHKSVYQASMKNIINSPDEFGKTFLHYAAFQGDEKLVNDLLADGANPKAQDAQGCYPINGALINNHEAVARALLSHTDIHHTDTFGLSPLSIMHMLEYVRLIHQIIVNTECPVCYLEVFEVPHEELRLMERVSDLPCVVMMPCQHIVCKDCFRGLQQRTHTTECPLCRQKVVVF